MIKPKTIAALNYPDLGIASDWSVREESLLQPITSTIQIVARDQYGISAHVAQTSSGGETSDGVAKCRPFFR